MQKNGQAKSQHCQLAVHLLVDIISPKVLISVLLSQIGERSDALDKLLPRVSGRCFSVHFPNEKNVGIELRQPPIKQAIPSCGIVEITESRQASSSWLSNRALF